jgi:hypothetical protein
MEDMTTQTHHRESKNNPHQRLQYVPKQARREEQWDKISMRNCTTEELPVPAFSFTI